MDRRALTTQAPNTPQTHTYGVTLASKRPDLPLEMSTGWAYPDADGAPSAATTDPERVTDTLEGFFQFFATSRESDHKTGNGYLTPGVFPEDAPRRLKFGLGAWTIPYDFDGPKNADGIAAGEPDAWRDAVCHDLEERNLSYAAYSTFSHDRKAAPEHSRFRIWMFTSRMIETPEEYRRCCLALGLALFDNRHDPQPTHMACVMYPPTHEPGAQRLWAQQHRGRFLDVDALLELADKLEADGILAPVLTRRGGEGGGSAWGAGSEPYERRGDVAGDREVSTQRGAVAAVDLRNGDAVLPWWRDASWEERQKSGQRGAVVARVFEDGGIWIFDFKERLKFRVATRGPFREEPEPEGSAGEEPEESQEAIQLARLEMPFSPDSLMENSLLDLRSAYEKIGVGSVEVLPAGVDVAIHAQEMGDHEVLFLTTGMGSGKTEKAKRESARVEKVLMLCPSVLLCHAAAHRFGFEIYKDAGTWGQNVPNRVVTTLNSEKKIHLKNPDLVIVDEADQLRKFAHSRCFCGGKNQSKAEAPDLVRRMIAHAAEAPRAILAEAAFDPRAIAWFVEEIQAHCRREGLPQKTFRIVAQEPPKAPGQVTLVTSRSCEALIRAHLGAKKPGDPFTWVAFSEARKAREFDVDVRALFPDLRVLLITGEESKRPEVQEMLLNPNALAHYDVVLASSAVGSGVSITAPADRVFVLHTYREMPASTVVQMIARCRNIRHPEIIMGVHKWKPKDGYTHDLAEIQEAICEEAKKDEELHLLVTESLSGRLSMLCITFLESAKLARLSLNENASNRLEVLREMLGSHGYHALEDLEQDYGPDAAQKAHLKEVRKEADREHNDAMVERVLDAPAYTDNEVRSLPIYTQTQEEADGVYQYELREIHEGAEVTAEMVRADGVGVSNRPGRLLRPGKLRRQASAAADVFMVRNDPQRLIEMDLEENTTRARRLNQPSERSHRARRAEFVSDLIEAVLGAPIGENPEPQVLGDMVVTAVEFLTDSNAWGLFPFTMLESEDEVGEWVHSQLRRVGCSLTSKEQVYTYNWDPIRPALARRLAQLERAPTRARRAAV